MYGLPLTRICALEVESDGFMQPILDEFNVSFVKGGFSSCCLTMSQGYVKVELGNHYIKPGHHNNLQ